MIKRKTVIAGAVAGTLFVGVSRAPAIIVGMVPIDDQGNVELDAQGNVIINDATFLNDFVGATRFYDAGFFGQTSTVANIEGGWVWNGHDVFVNRAVDQYIIDPANPLASGPPPYVDHATGVGNVLAGLGPALFLQQWHRFLNDQFRHGAGSAAVVRRSGDIAWHPWLV